MFLMLSPSRYSRIPKTSLMSLPGLYAEYSMLSQSDLNPGIIYGYTGNTSGRTLSLYSKSEIISFFQNPEHLVYPDGAECDPHRSAQSVSEIKPNLPAVFSCQRRRKSQLLLLSRQYVPDRYADICPEDRQHPSAAHGQSALHLFILTTYLRHGYLRCYAPAEHSSVYHRYGESRQLPAATDRCCCLPEIIARSSIRLTAQTHPGAALSSLLTFERRLRFSCLI